jgi:amino acid adenylation domain-containing protein
MSETISETAAAQVFRLSPQQRRAGSLAPGGGGPYRAVALVRIAGPLDTEALETALAAVAARHEILRTTFPVPAGMSLPGQAVHEDLAPPRLERRDDISLETLWEELAARPFQPDREPPFAAVLIRMAPENHLLGLALHALCADEAALDVLVRDLRQAYSGGVETEPAVQYADVAAALEEMLEGEESAAGRAWWREVMPAPPSAVLLPFEREAGDAPFAPRRVQASLAPGLAASPAVCLAAWQTLLARLAPGIEVVGVELAGRHYEGFETAMGPFARTVPVRLAARPGEPFAALAARLEEQWAALADWQDYFAWEGFFAAVFCWKDAKDSKDSRDGWRIERSWACTDRFRLRLTVDGGVAELAYDGARFQEKEARTLLASWCALLESTVAAPRTQVGDLELVGPEDRRKLAAWNATERPFAPVPVHQLFFEQAKRTPQATALSTVPAGETVTYAELAERVRTLAATLHAAGVGPDVPVALQVERSVEMVVGVLAILAAGGAYVPIDPGFPEARRALILEASGAGVVLGPSPGAPSQPRALPWAKGTRPSGPNSQQQIQGGGGPEARVSLAQGNALGWEGADSAAYILFTSGSTGTPKGVVVRHGALTTHMLWMQEAYPLAPGDRVLQKTPLGFDASVWEVFAPLLAGAELVLAEPEAHRDPARLAWATAESGATVLQVVPSLLLPLLGEKAFAACSALRRLFCGGEPLSAELAGRVHALLPGAELINLYGPTETTVQVVTWTTDWSERSAPGEAVPIGRPIHNARVHLLDSGMRPVPPGLPGELWIGGVSLARGYLGRPDLTAASFLPDPFSAEPGARMYRTGDLGRAREDGALVFLGRVGREVKIRGYRFDPGEIEDLLGWEEGVREAAVVVREDRLLAYLAQSAPASLDLARLRARLAAQLPDYLVPSAFVVLPALPRTPGGKLDRAALPEPVDLSAAAGEAGYAAPRTPAEEVLAEIWAGLLQRERVGVHDDFFELGGHSLLGAQLVARVRQALGVELSLRTVFETPTVAGLAAQVAAVLRGVDVPVAPPVERVAHNGDSGDFPLSFAQQRLWVLDRLAPGHSYYNGFSAVRLTGPLDERALLTAFREIGRVQGALRTVFPEVAGHPVRRPVQRPVPDFVLDLPVIDLSALPEGLRLPEALRLAHAEARRPFDLATGPLVRLAMLRLVEGVGEQRILFTAVHHIVSDAWSSGIIYRDLMTVYAEAIAGRIARLPEPPVQYVDYAVWQRRWFAEVRETELAWWRQRLADLPVLDLPADRPRRGGSDAAAKTADVPGITLPVAVPRERSEALRRLARAESVTPFMLLLAAFQALLFRWSGQDDVVTGVPVANRERAEIEGLVGFFVNTLVLRTSCAGDPTVGELLARVREVSLGAFVHQAVPFEVLVEDLAPERDFGRQPLFQVMFQLQTVPLPPFVLPGVTIEALAVDLGAAPFDLGLDLRETPDGVMGLLEGSGELFDPSTLERLRGHLDVLLRGMAGGPGVRLSELPLLREGERHQITVEWNDTASPYESDRCIHELFTAQAARTPDAEALAFTERRVTYAELDAESNRLAHHLREQGAGPGARVALRMEASADFFIALLAILKTGAAYLPLDPTWPDARVEVLLDEARAALVLTSLDQDAIARCSAAPLPLRSAPESLAYVVFTSGSTGRPKGVAISHRAVVRMVRSAAAMPLGPDDRVAQASNVSFDGLVYEIWGALLHGGCLVGLPRDVMLSLPALAEYARRERISLILAPAALLHQIAREDPAVLQTVRQVTSGGEAFDARHARTLLEANKAGQPAIQLLNDYGPTETTCFLLVEKVTEVADGARTVPLGRPIGNTVAAVLDRHLHPVAIGSPGELCLGGEGLAHGYLGNPALTAERFVPDPVGPVGSGIAGTRLYRTGDRVRLLPDGRFDFLGRFDDQVKVRGFRIEPGEIEEVLASHPAVAAVVVLPREVEGSRALVAYVVPEDLDLPSLRAALRERLPEYMVPAFFVPLPALPINPNGKVDRAALRRMEPRRDSGAPSRPPRGALEEAVAAIWCEVLEIERIGAEDRFFDLGGHSLLALQVLARLRDTMGVEVPLRELFAAPTVEGLAAWIGTQTRPAEAAPLVPIPRDRPLPLSFTQERLWLVDRLYPGTPLYNVPTVARFRGPLSRPALAAALTGIVRRHEALRTRYAMAADGTPVQIVEPAAEIAVPLADLAALPEARRLAEAERLTWEESLRPFDLRVAPLLRALLVRLGDGDHALALTGHHIVSDGWSQHLFAREIGTLYELCEAIAAGRPSPLAALPPLPVQYADFAVWQRRHLTADVLAVHLAWWRERLAGAPPLLELPADRPRPPFQSFAGEFRGVLWAPPFVESLRTLARRGHGTLFQVLLAGFKALVTRLTGREDVLVGSPMANRPRPELEGLIGFFANTLVLRTGLSNDPAFREIVARVRETSLGAWEHQDLPFERLVEELRPRRDPSHNPVFQVMFVHHSDLRAGLAAAEPAIDLPGLTTEPFGGTRAVSRYDLEVYALESDAGLFLAMGFCTALFDAGRIERLLGHLETFLRGALADPGLHLSELPLLTAAQTSQILAGWSIPASATPEGEETLLYELFERQVERTPDALALIAGEERWTYRELDERAEEIAADLRGRGVGMEDRVVVSQPRTPEMVAMLIGVLKAGAAYVPVDPAAPAARREAIVAAAGVMGGLTTGIGADVEASGFRRGGPQDAEGTLCGRPGWGKVPHGLDPESHTEASPGLAQAPALGETRTVEGGHAGCLRHPADRPYENSATRRLTPVGASANALAYLLHTSGSTGTPKGVAVPHSAAVALVRWAGTVFSRADLAGVLAATSISFDLSVFEIFVPLAQGGTVILAENVLELPRLPAAGAVTLVNTVPSALAELLRAEGMPGGVRVVNLAGEALTRELADRVLALPQIERLYNLYGPSEDTTYSTFAEVPRGTASMPPIGRPITGGRAVVVDRWLRPAPVGVPGELCLAGTGLARGYLGRPAETAEKWVPDPFFDRTDPSDPSDRSDHQPGARLYRSGDLARLRPDGDLEFLGRIDHQVKVRGFRIEPGEIEAALRTVPGVTDAVVALREEGGERRLVAWVAGAPLAPTTLDPAGLRSFLRERLPEPLVPSFFVVLPDLPRTTTGKVDRAALPAPQLVPAVEEGTEEGGPVEDLLAGVWAEVLGVERVGLRDSFFDLGGHSLLATRLMARLRTLLGVELPVRAVFEAPTVASFTRVVLAAERRTAPPLVRRTDRGDPPLSFAQERMWFLERLDPGAAYHIPLALGLTGALDAAALAGALGAVIQRHEALRTSFPFANGPVQRIDPAPAISLPCVDLAGLPSTLRETEHERLSAHLSSALFNLETGPLLRALLVRTGADEHVLRMTFHHTIIDGWSLGVLLRDLAAFYRARREGVPSGLQELPVQYADWAVWQRRWLESGALGAGIAWWQEHLGSDPADLQLPADRPRPAVPSYRGAEHREILPTALLDPLRRLARARGASLFMVLLAAWQAFLVRHTGQDGFAVGTPVAGRDREETEDLIGLFVNTLALRAEVTAGEGFTALLARVRESTLGAFAHAWVPFERVVEAVQPERSLSRSPLFQTLLALQDLPRSTVALPDLTLAPVDVEVRTSPFDLTLMLATDEKGLYASWIWALDLFDASTVIRFAGRFRTFLAALSERTAGPERALDDLPLLTPAERQALLHEWNDAETPLPGSVIHRWVARHVAERPDAVAVEAGEESLTYAALDRRARRWARRLRSVGVGPDVPVGLCAGNALDLATGMLATLQAGGACLPLDPEYPPERLAYLLEDARPAAVLASGELAESIRRIGPIGQIGQIRPIPVLPLNEPDAEPDTESDPEPLTPPAVLGGHLASVFYTSGSTGRPKGVGVTHHAICRFLLDPRWEITPADRVAQLSSPSFDASTLEIWGALLRGACLVGLRREEVLAPPDLAAAIRRLALTMLVIPPSWFHRVAAELPDAFATVSIMSIGGEAGDPTAFARVVAAGGPRWLFHGYGPTEVTTLTTVNPVRTVAAGVPLLPAGRPLADVRIHVLDPHLRLLPQGVAGELYAGGDRLARGYLGRPDLTAERFIPDPFGPPGERLYATGDLARLLPDGALEILGRRDRQVKIRGFRVEPGEIEAVLAEHPAVAQAAVIVRGTDAERRLIAFVVLRGARDGIDAAELRAWLAGRLPAFLLPAALVLRPDLPLTANEKIDREALARLPFEPQALSSSGRPRTTTEERLAALWTELLDGVRPGPEDSFFGLGGNSLLATWLQQMVHTEFGLDLPLRAVFEAPTLAGLARKIDTLSALNHQTETEP